MSVQLLIVGGGIGGLTAALALGRAGHQVDVLEQAEQFAEFGAGIQLGPNVVRRLRAMGLRDALDEVVARPTMLCVRSAHDGDELARMVFDGKRARRYGAPYMCVHRADLHGVLLHALQTGDWSRRVAVHTGARVSRIATRGGEAVSASAHDSRAWEADGLIGADGVWGRTRERVFEQDRPPRRTGHTAWRALVSQAQLPQALRSDRVQVWLGSRLHAVAYPVRRGDQLNIVVLAESQPEPGLSADARDWNQEASQASLRQATGQVGASGLQALLDAVPAWRAWTLHDRDPLQGPEQMVAGRVALLGDAAHPMLPYLAQGAGMAIEDAVVMAEVLEGADAAALPAAFGRYAARRWARAGQVQARSRRNGRIFHATGLTRVGRDLALRIGGERVLDVPWLYAG